MKIIYPPRLTIGDTIGIAAPASPPEKPELIDEVLARFTQLGFKVRPGKFLRKRDSYLAGSDDERAEDINALFADPKVKGVFALRGGYGSCRLLPLIDYQVIRENPKPFIGYSDITAMHLALLKKAGLVTFHGSNASSAFTRPNDRVLRRALLERGPGGEPVTLFSRADRAHARVETLVPGKVRGRLLGGNFTCLLRLLATPYAPDFRGAILFLEDTGEKAYRIDGMFAHLRLAGILPQLAGLVLGQFDYTTDAKEPRRIKACLEREAKRIGVPCVARAPIGHFPGQIVVPQGVAAELDADAGRLSFTVG